MQNEKRERETLPVYVALHTLDRQNLVFLLLFSEASSEATDRLLSVEARSSVGEDGRREEERKRARKEDTERERETEGDEAVD